ncbi:hypothetical protein LAC81_35245 (plasmid) [Ensifer adhaerens]|uniref:hypothetical protein n=1 Tax=Ensifer adhaerens TaxID=106592 RepID=UPI001CBE5F51|nr:hypothetical protein [Ensifer adhaerens]MBZ7927200.1 hypothetical protein [Ensifer adhaerens]UAX98232.1 hypothetical protein LAC78_36545 [Ensifer adhaerens]UAY05614.1 hypothetical protein LAC80_35250 [Ensifer adhaerens]UAY12992.1 hypothetical protein LAC81_35245 [Ensifer adhaerens]
MIPADVTRQSGLAYRNHPLTGRFDTEKASASLEENGGSERGNGFATAEKRLAVANSRDERSQNGCA